MTDKEFRYRHSEGITDVGLIGDGSKLITCGSDGDIRVYQDFDDDEPVTFSASDGCFGLTCFADKVFVGTDNFTVEMFELPTGKKLGVKAKFTGAVNHVDVSKDGKWLVAGSADMTVQIIDLEDTSILPRKLEAHKAPVLAVTIDPLLKYVATAGCDGDVCVWFLIESSVRLVKRWERVFQRINDISLSPTLCRMSWSPDGQFLAVPQEDLSVALYSRENWESVRNFKSQTLTKMASVLAFSSCGTYIGGGGSDGSVIIWNASTATPILELGAATNKNAITGITFSQTNTHVYFTDDRGRFGHVDDFAASTKKSGQITTENNVADVFDDGMDELFDDADNENEFSISRIKAELGFTEDEFVGVEKATKGLGIQIPKKDLDDDASSIMSGDFASKSARTPIIQTVNPFTDPQDAFQPSSTPVHLEHRFMVWNNVGIIRSFSTEDDDAIDIEFHDASFHSSIHLRNQFDFIYGTMSNEVVVLACEKGTEHPSKLFCLNFASWDSSKEWTVDLPKGEEITCLAVGTGWIAASTNLNRLRLFSCGGCQKFLYELSGQVVTMSGFENLLFIACHSGVGINGNQSITYSFFKVNGCKLLSLKMDVSLPLSPKSTLSWIGFTDEGTPCFSDSLETFRILNGGLWTPFCSMKELLSGPNDHFWIVGASETGQNIRAIKCKGSKYPATLPRPTLMLLDAKIPLCELDTEKSQLEESMLRALLLKSISKKMDRKGFEIAEFKDKSEKDIRETLMKLFVLASKGDRDLRASEYISLMPTAHAVQVAVKYASRTYHTALADRLTRIGRKKMIEECDESGEEDDEDFETRVKTNFVKYGNGGGGNDVSRDRFHGLNEAMDNSVSGETLVRKFVVDENPLLKKQKDEIRSILAPTTPKNNPFKRDQPKKVEEESQSQDSMEAGKGLAFIDAWKKPPEKPTTIEYNPKPAQKRNKKKDAAAEKDKNGLATDGAATGPVKKKQPTLFDMGGKRTTKSTNKLDIDSSPLSEAMLLGEDTNSASPAEFENSEPPTEQESLSEDSLPSMKGDKKRKRTEEAKVDNDNEGNGETLDTEKKQRLANKFAAFSKKHDD